MAALPNELGETLVEKIVNANLTSSDKNEASSDNSMVDHLANLDLDDDFVDDNFFHKNQSRCKDILWTPVHSGTNVRTWDLLVLIPNVVFLIVLVSYRGTSPALSAQ